MKVLATGRAMHGIKLQNDLSFGFAPTTLMNLVLIICAFRLDQAEALILSGMGNLLDVAIRLIAYHMQFSIICYIVTQIIKSACGKVIT